jgi:hypothetical protein
MLTFLITGENISGQKFDQDKIKMIKPLRFGLEVHFNNGRVITVDGNTVNLNYTQLSQEVNNDLRTKRSTGIHTYTDYQGRPQVFINNDRHD